ncbi:MAG: response regulator, partial [Candidatus Latescibacteria bacterium]|nr:response regulator [Candidatus Latescibacterota bacterium]
MEVWFASPQTPEGTSFGSPGFMRLDRRGRGFREWKKGERSWVTSVDRAVLSGRVREIQEGIGTSEKDIRGRIDALPETPWVSVANFGVGFIGFITSKPFTESEMAVACRFTDVFGGAYARFQELKEKEEQNRELTIQNAIERVRARALGMQESRELDGVSVALFEALGEVGIERHLSWIGILDPDQGAFKFSQQVEGLDALVSSTVLRSEIAETPSSDLLTEWQAGSVYRFGEHHGEALQPLLNFWHGVIRRSNPEFAWPSEYDVVEHYYNVSANHRFGFLGFGRFTPITKQEAEITKRFADVFEFAYSRFLELKQKEDQNRELKIQNAIERIRARALGMQESCELSDVVVALTGELNELDVIQEMADQAVVSEGTTGGVRANIAIWNVGDQYWDAWMRPGPDKDFRVITMDRRRLYKSDDTEKARREGQRDFGCYVPVEDVSTFKIYWRELNVEAGHADSLQPTPTNNAFASLSSFFDAGSIEVRLYSDEPIAFPQEVRDVIARFTAAFEFAYTRFLELQEKEDQNRELKVQNALERVRSRALGMQESSELDEVCAVLFEALGELSFDTFWCVIGLIDEPGDLFTISAQVAGAQELIQSVASLRASVEASATSRTIVDAWRRKDTAYTLEVIGEAVSEHLEFWEPVLQEKNPDYQFPKAFAEADKIYQFGSLFQYGLIEIGTPQAVGQEEQDVLKRFTDGFEFAYSRFLELKEKEDQARAADRRAAVDRVRAEATAMEKTEDIADVVKALWDGLVGQGFVFSTLVFRVEDEQEQELQMYLATLEGAGGLAFPESNLLSRGMLVGVNLYRSTMPLGPETLARQMERGVYSGMSEQVNVDAQALWGFEFPASVLKNTQRLVVPFAYGQISVVREIDPFSEADIERVEPFADASSLGFTRYFDFRRLEGQNIALEAMKFTDEGVVRVEASVRGTYPQPLPEGRGVRSKSGDRQAQGVVGGGEVQVLEIAVSDTGIGIPENQQEAVFEEFRQVDGTSTRRHQGTGLGLAITKQLIALLGGRIGLESEVGKGSTFRFEIPVRYIDQVEVQESNGTEAVSSSGVELQTTGQAKTIVSIDDDPNVAVLLRQELEAEGYTVISALNADEGVALVKKHKPVAVTVDILMPGKDGWQTIGMLKNDPETQDIPIIVLSAMENKSLGLAMGVKDYLIKPVDRDALLAALGRVDNGSVKDVLVVDDEPSAADLLTQILSEEGMSSRRAANGKEALVRIAERVPDAILLDLMMPEMDGFEVIAKLQEDPVWRHIPVIVITAKDLESGESTYLAKHVEKVVQKGGLDPSGLAQAVRDAVG